MNENNDITTHEMYPYCDEFLTDTAKEALNHKTIHLVHQYNKLLSTDPSGISTYVRECALVRYLGFSCHISEAGEAIQILCSKLNDLAEQGFIIATLKPMLVIPYVQIAPVPWDDSCAVMSYVAISTEGDEYIKKYLAHLNTPEGGVPKLLSEFTEPDKDTSTYAISEE